LIGDIRLDVISEIQVVLGSTDDEGLEYAEYRLTKGVCHGLHRHTSRFDYREGNKEKEGEKKVRMR
jgi:hypothetical protein